MNGIDISRYQKGINLAAVPCDFVIVKATQGTSYVSTEYKKQITQADNLGKLLGAYHYAGGGGAIPEAKHFLDVVDPYVRKAILVLDWEWDQNPNMNNPEYAKAFLAYVKQATGVTPFIYMSKSVCRMFSWDATYPLWAAQYANYNPTGYKDRPWTDTKGFGAWKECQIFQYSSRGSLPGYNGNLDLDKAYITAEEWQMYARGEIETTEPAPATYPLLKKGDKNEFVRNWQVFLNLNGYTCGLADGIFGPKTEAAVKKWQKDHGLKADGIIGPKTWASLPMMS